MGEFLHNKWKGKKQVETNSSEEKDDETSTTSLSVDEEVMQLIEGASRMLHKMRSKGVPIYCTVRALALGSLGCC